MGENVFLKESGQNCPSSLMYLLLLKMQKLTKKESRETLQVTHDVAKIVMPNISVEAMRCELIYYELLRHNKDSHPAGEPTA